MEFWFVILVIILIASLLALVFFSSYTKLKKYKERMEKAENLIDEYLNKKLDLIIAINGDVKKVTGKKDYLKEYVSIRDLIITLYEKDLKLDDAMKLINDLRVDYQELSSDENFTKEINELRQINETLVAAKNVFNQNAIKSNQIIKTFPNNIIAKLANFKIRSYYNNNNKTDDGDTF